MRESGGPHQAANLWRTETVKVRNTEKGSVSKIILKRRDRSKIIFIKQQTHFPMILCVTVVAVAQ